jgi:peptidoglycan/xylan/chitin deacetylase (PgdA/CDA1 family)/ribosomal protein S18 acetylase RimI-like enzyme
MRWVLFTEDFSKGMDNQKITFRFATRDDFDGIARLHFINKKFSDRGFFNFFKDKIILLRAAGTTILVAENEEKKELAGVVIFVKNDDSIRKALLSPCYIFRSFVKFLAGYYGFSKEIFAKIFIALFNNLNFRKKIFNRAHRLPKAKIISIAVDNAYRRQGMGSQLTEMVFDYLSRESVDSLYLTVAQDNTAAIAMYEKLGFRTVGEDIVGATKSFIMIRGPFRATDAGAGRRYVWKKRKLRIKFILKKICKECIIIALSAAGYGYSRKLFLRNKKRILILAYHRISDSSGSNYAVKEEEFKRHILYLLHNYHIVGLAEIVDYIKGKTDLPDNALAITFDDGYEEIYRSAYPILKRYNLPACVFLVTGYIDTQGEFSWDEWFGLENNKLLSWAQVKEMSENGITFGIHTSTHPNLARLSPQQVTQEISASQAALEKALGKKAEFFAYPFGTIMHMNDITKKVVAGQGLKCALTSIYGTVDLNSDIFRLRRIVIDGSDSFYIFKQKIDGKLDVLSLLGCSFWQGLFVRLNRLLGLER